MRISVHARLILVLLGSLLFCHANANDLDSPQVKSLTLNTQFIDDGTERLAIDLSVPMFQFLRVDTSAGVSRISDVGSIQTAYDFGVILANQKTQRWGYQFSSQIFNVGDDLQLLQFGMGFAYRSPKLMIALHPHHKQYQILSNDEQTARYSVNGLSSEFKYWFSPAIIGFVQHEQNQAAPELLQSASADSLRLLLSGLAHINGISPRRSELMAGFKLHIQQSQVRVALSRLRFSQSPDRLSVATVDLTYATSLRWSWLFGFHQLIDTQENQTQQFQLSGRWSWL